jgi:hypothetical protein
MKIENQYRPKWKDRLKSFQQKLADVMQRQSQRLSVKAQKILLVIFCLLTAVYLATIVLGGFGISVIPDNGSIAKPKLLKPNNLVLPDSTWRQED